MVVHIPETLAQGAASAEHLLSKLTRLFSRVRPMRIPVQVTGVSSRVADLKEKTVITCGNSEMVFFTTRLPLAINDLLLLENADGSFEADVVVVALHTFEGSSVVGAKFLWETAPNSKKS